MINTTVNRIDYKGDGVTTVFPIPFPFIERSDVTVSIVGKDNETTTITSDYYINEEEKTLTYPGYHPGEEPEKEEWPDVLADGERLIITRDITVNQERDLGEVWPFDEAEDALDKITMILQDLSEKMGRTIKIPLAADADSFDATFPYPKEGNTVMWQNGHLVNTDYKEPIQALTDQATAAAKAAKESEENAKTSEETCKEYLTKLMEGADLKKNEILEFVNALLDTSEKDLSKYTEEMLESLDICTDSAKSEILLLIAEAKHYADVAKKAAEFDPELYFTKDEVNEKLSDTESDMNDKLEAKISNVYTKLETDTKISEAIAAILDYDDTYF